jgi:hypothetical protein
MAAQQQVQVSKRRAARAAGRRRSRAGGGEPEPADWRPPWYNPATRRVRPPGSE